MRFDSVNELKGEAFRRLTGVRSSTFEEMAALLGAAKRKQKAAGGKPNTLCIEDQLLMMLEYWREYRTYFHIGQTYGISSLMRGRSCADDARRRGGQEPFAQPFSDNKILRCHVVESLMRVRRVSQLKSCGGDDFAPRLHG